MSGQEKAQTKKRARRAARNLTHPGAHSAYALRNNGATRPRRTSSRAGGQVGRYVPAIEDLAVALATLPRALARYVTRGKPESPKARRSGVAADVEHHRGGAR